jgi:hypothetical protein
MAQNRSQNRGVDRLCQLVARRRTSSATMIRRPFVDGLVQQYMVCQTLLPTCCEIYKTNEPSVRYNPRKSGGETQTIHKKQ